MPSGLAALPLRQLKGWDYKDQELRCQTPRDLARQMKVTRHRVLEPDSRPPAWGGAEVHPELIAVRRAADRIRVNMNQAVAQSERGGKERSPRRPCGDGKWCGHHHHHHHQHCSKHARAFGPPVEASDCSMSSCVAPAGSPCRTGRGWAAHLPLQLPGKATDPVLGSAAAAVRRRRYAHARLSRHLRRALTQVLAVYPSASIKDAGSGLTLVAAAAPRSTRAAHCQQTSRVN